MAPPSPPPLLSIRTTLILTVGMVLGVVAGVLTAIAGQHVALAAVVGLGIAGSSVGALNKLIGM